MDLCLINYIADKLKPYHVKVYIYTHSHDVMQEILDNPYWEQSDNLTINGSDTAMYDKKFVVTTDKNQPNLCKGDCSKCDMCKYTNHKTIYVLKH